MCLIIPFSSKGDTIRKRNENASENIVGDIIGKHILKEATNIQKNDVAIS